MKPAWVYRLYAADGDLLYVGMTWNPELRFMQHAADKPWWPEVDHHDADWFPSREEAAAVEAEAIWQEHPRYNIRNPIVDCRSVGYSTRSLETLSVAEALFRLGLVVDAWATLDLTNPTPYFGVHAVSLDSKATERAEPRSPRFLKWPGSGIRSRSLSAASESCPPWRSCLLAILPLPGTILTGRDSWIRRHLIAGSGSRSA